MEGTLRAALDGWRTEGTAIADVSTEDIARWIDEEIGGFIALTMGRYTAEARAEFSDQCCVEFATIPLSMLTDVVRQARREISHPEKFVPFVFDRLADKLKKFDVEGSRLRRLAEIAGV